MIRDVDKLRAGLSQPAAHILITLALHAESFRPSEGLLAQQTGMQDRTVRRCLVQLRELGLIEVDRGRHHLPNRYAIRQDRVSALPCIQTGSSVRSDDVRPDRPSALDRIVATVRPDRGDSQTGPTILLSKKRVSGEKEEEAEGASGAPAAAASLTETEAFQIAGEVARQLGRPSPQRGEKSREAMATLIAEAEFAADGRPWTSTGEALRQRLIGHYERDDEFVAGKAYVLTLAKQVPQPEMSRPPEPRPPRRPEAPEAPYPDDAAAREAWTAIATKGPADGLFSLGVDFIENRVAQSAQEREAYPTRLAAYERAMRTWESERDDYVREHAEWRLAVGESEAAE